ncbi:hypothetical protein HPB51_022228 [Rhipicephalus microplus]|uniref:Uncharacterized protein n=1 Tax=Rhipicephalus microplus TaxID=6941 RepID=A0A9J6E426_RHIMP|nr:hypothetical protein HPB51_022228 [Rhipicephalus microplus]
MATVLWSGNTTAGGPGRLKTCRLGSYARRPIFSARSGDDLPLAPSSSNSPCSEAQLTGPHQGKTPKCPRKPTSHHMIPGEPPIPLQPFARLPFKWRQQTSRSQSRRRKQQQVFPPRAPAPLWTPGPLPLHRSGGGPESTEQFAAVAVAMGTSGGGSVPYRPREPNPRIPRKESKTPASHMHLPPFPAAVSSKPPNKSPSPNTATRVQVPPRAAAFKTEDFASTVPLLFPLRAAFAANECCASPAALPKRNETTSMNSETGQGSSGGGGKSKAAGGGNMTARWSNDGGGVRESDMLGAKPKKPPRMNNMTFTKSSERSKRSRLFRYEEIGTGNVHEAGPRPSRCVQTGTLRVRPMSTHRPRASTVERVPWAQRPGINCRGVDLRNFTRPDQEPSYGIGQTVYARRLRLGDLIGSDKKTKMAVVVALLESGMHFLRGLTRPVYS